jgi:hypothetical protein
VSGILYDPPDHGTPDAAPLLAGLRDGAWLDAQNFPPLAYAVPGVIPEGLALLVGPPKIGKSWLVLTVDLAAAAGGKAFGIAIPNAQPCIWPWRTATGACRTAAASCCAAIRSPASSSTC